MHCHAETSHLFQSTMEYLCISDFLFVPTFENTEVILS